MEATVEFTLPTREVAPYLVARCNERRESARTLSMRANRRSP